MEKDKSLDFLNSIYKTSEMGIIGINDVIEKTNNPDFSELLLKQKQEYNKILDDCKKVYYELGKKENELGIISKTNSKVMSEMMLLKNSNDGKIAKMMMEGTNKGIIKINKGLNENPLEDKKIINIAEKLLKIMENNIGELKIYL